MPPPDPNRRRAKLVIAAVAIGAGVGLIFAAVLNKPKTVSFTEGGEKGYFDAEWITLPTPDDVIAAYPQKARDQAITEHVYVDMGCRVGPKGGLENCIVVSDSMPGWGFDAAALTLSARFRVKTKAPDGTDLTGKLISVPLGFDPIFAPDFDRGRRMRL